MISPLRKDNSTTEVFIVGAGPTGLAAAMDLARFGISCRIIDRLPAPAPHSRATAIQARTLELFEQRGFVEPFLHLGQKGRAANFYSAGKHLLRLDFGPLPSAYPYLLFLDQSVTERIMTGQVESLGVRIERGVELIDFEDTGDRVNITLRHRDGHIEHTHALYLIGCDGAHSFVREHLKLGFEGKTYEQSFLLADLHIDWDLSQDELDIFASEEGLVGIFPLGQGRHRLVADLHTQVPHDSQPSLAECQALADRRLEHPARFSDLVWSSYFHVNSRRVEKLRAGRVFVAGDAAHIHSPAAGQGMNTGIQEAINLAWKLALVVRGEAEEQLLDTYNEERQPIERQVLASTDVVLNIVGAQHGPVRFLRDHLGPHIVGTHAVEDLARRFVSELSIHYRSSSLTFEQDLHGGPRAGERAPDAPVTILSGPDGRSGPSRLYTLLDPAAFALLIFPEAAPSAASPEITDAVITFAGALRAPVHVWQLTACPGENGRNLSKPYGTVRPSLYLIRPDGYVLARAHLHDVGRVAEFCETWFGQHAEQFR